MRGWGHGVVPIGDLLTVWDQGERNVRPLDLQVGGYKDMDAPTLSCIDGKILCCTHFLSSQYYEKMMIDTHHHFVPPFYAKGEARLQVAIK